MKEIIIIITIIIIIFSGYFLSKEYLEKTSNELQTALKELKDSIIYAKKTNQKEEIKEKANKTYDKWSETEEKWSLIVLHDELDLIETSIIKMKAGVEQGELNKSLEELENAIFLINHIQEKEKFNLKNIF